MTNYRPQFAYPPPPPGARDEVFEYFYDEQYVSALNATLAPNQTLNDIPLNVEADAEFRARSVQIGNPTHSVALGVIIRDGLGNYMSREYVPMQFHEGYTNGPTAGGEGCALEPELVVPAGGNFTLSLKNISDPPPPPGPPVAAPVAIPTLSGGSLEAYAGVQWGAISYKGRLWQFVVDPSGNVAAYRQSGAAWSQVGGESGPSGVGCPMFWDGTSGVVTFYDTNSQGLQDFNLDTGAWGSLYGTTNAPGFPFYAQTLNKRLDGSFIVTGFTVGDNVLFDFYANYTAGAWSTLVDFTINGGGPEALVSYAPSIMDSAGRLHIVYWSGTSGNFVYQQVTAGGALGPTSIVTAAANLDTAELSYAPSGFHGTWGARLEVVGDQLFMGVSVAGGTPYPAVYIGTGLSAPSWALSGAIDTSGVVPAVFPNIFFSDGTLYALWIASAQQIFLASASAAGFLTGWKAELFYDPLAAPPLFTAGHSVLGFMPLPVFGSPLVGVSVDYTDTTASVGPVRFWLGVSSPAPSSISVAPFPITFRGVKRFYGDSCNIPIGGGQ